MGSYSKPYETADFFVSKNCSDSGPPSLFKRVRQVISVPRLLVLPQKRLAKICKTFSFAQEELDQIFNFYPEEWKLYLVQVRIDTGKFIESTWYRWIGAKCVFLTLGYGEGIRHLSWSRTDDPDDDRWIWCDNFNKDLVDFVEKANATLLAENAPFPPPARPLPPKETEAAHG